MLVSKLVKGQWLNCSGGSIGEIVKLLFVSYNKSKNYVEGGLVKDSNI